MTEFFGIKNETPYSYCLSCSPELLWLHVISDLLITLSFYAVFLGVVRFIRQRKNLPYPWLFALFAGFIVACGATHLLSVIMIWLPLYWLDGLFKAFAAALSVAILVPRLHLIPRILSVSGATHLQAEAEQAENKLAVISDSVEACILDSLTSQIAVLDTQGVIVAVNKAWRRFGKENGSQAMPGFDYLDACKRGLNQSYGDQGAAAHIGIAAVLAGELETFQLEYSCHLSDQQRWFYMNVSPLRGSRRGAVLSHENITERKYREQQDKDHLDQLAHVTRRGLMGEMASGIAHEVNQPLSAISSYTQVSLNLINTEDPDLVKLTEILHKTQQQALRAGWIIHRMREFVQAHAKYRSTADVNHLIHNAAGLCSAELKRNHIRLTFELKSNLPPIYVDYVQIEQVIINLIRNSVDALQNLPPKQQRQLSIHSGLVGDNGIQVRMKDNGPGLDEDQQQKILTPFYSTKTDSMGMGLPISRSLVEAHDGTLRFDSAPGKGATFYFTLPIHRKPDGDGG
ncbi:ATP-binding protein [Methylobacter sp. Wu8]|uniref:PAS domain-containing sensor histidine kinase n=1 Tax=Methylobacter sp. Wu8 TaxID=3118457 RepID=UPI002F32820C